MAKDSDAPAGTGAQVPDDIHSPLGDDLPVAPVRLLHRDGDSWIHLLHEPLAGGSSIEVGKTVPRDTRYGFVRPPDERWIPELAAQLDWEGFMSINAFARPARAQEWNLSRLNAAHVDCDGDLEFSEAARALLDLERRGILPEISILIQTGNRGAWALWLLEDEGSLPPNARQGNRNLLRRVNAALIARVQETAPMLLPDAKAQDLVRHARVPGTRHRLTGERARYCHPHGNLEKPIVYQIDELGRRIGVMRPPQVRTLGGKKPKRKNGHVTRHSRYLDEFEAVLEHRGGFVREGCRHDAAYVLAYSLAIRGASLSETCKELEHFGQMRCRPKLPQHDCRSTAQCVHRYVTSGGRVQNRTLAKQLGVTREEADQCGLRSIRPDYESRVPKGRRRRMTRRREIVTKLWEEIGPNGREIHRRLGRIGEQCSPQTVYNDLSALGLRRPPELPLLEAGSLESLVHKKSMGAPREPTSPYR